VTDLRTTEGVLQHADGSSTWHLRATPTDPPAARPAGAPVVVLHGGPGMGHDYLRTLTRLASSGREVFLYDQVGCGRSSHHEEAPADHWRVELFVAELEALLAHWEIGEDFHLLGQSWGGMLAAEYVLAHPRGVRSLSLLDSPASMPAWARGTRRLLAQLPEATRATIEQHEAAGTFEHPDYLAAVDEFYARFLCRVQPWPSDLTDSFRHVDDDPTVYRTMIGPSEFTITGSLAEWTVAGRLGRIGVPTLVGYGEHDEATDSWRPFAEEIPDVVVHEFPGASHTPHLETPEEFFAVVEDFLHRADRRA